MRQTQTKAKSAAGRYMNRCNDRTRSAGKTQTKYTNTNGKARNR